MKLTAALKRLLPVFALLVLGLGVTMTIAVAGNTLGYDFLAYHAAATRVLAGAPAYDTFYASAGGFGLFYYPPTFIPLVLPFGLLAAGLATWIWMGLLLAAFGAGVALMPVARSTRWLIVLLAGVSWPFLYAIKLGQVGPLLFLLFALGWRWLDRGPVLGVAGALGAAIKIQPGLILVWALLTRRWTTVLLSAGVLVVLALVATLLAGIGAWSDFLGLLTRVSDPITTPHNFTPGAAAYQLGASRETALLIQWISMGAAALTVVLATRRMSPVPSYFVAVIASQLLSPILWDHYALLLLLPVAWLVDRGQWWTVLFVLVTPVFLAGALPVWVYPVAFWTCLLTVVAQGWRAPAPEVAPDVAPPQLRASTVTA